MLHFFDIGGRVKIVSVQESPSDAIGEELADGGFSGSGCAHHENDHGNGATLGRASGATQREQGNFRRNA